MATKKSNTKTTTKTTKTPAKKPTTKKTTSTSKGKSTSAASSKKATAVAKTTQNKQVKNTSKGWLIGLIVIVAIIVIIAVIIKCFNKPDPSDPTAKISYSEAFFIDDNEKYLLWNADGKRLTEDEYDHRSDFVGGYALVKKDGQFGIIRDDGKTSVEFGKYGNITTKGGLYLAQDGNTKVYYLITGAGEILAEGSELETYALGTISGFAAAKIDDKIVIFNYNGKKIAEMNFNTEAEDPEMNYANDFGIVHYGNHNILLDTRDGAVLAEFEGERYSFDSTSKDRKLILLEDYDDSSKFKLFADGVIYDLDETKYYGITMLDGVLGYDDYTKLALLDDNYKVAKWVSTSLQLKDTNNYATKTDNGVEIYYNGEKVKDFDSQANVATTGVLFEDYYAIKSGDTAKFYNLDGSVGIEHDYKEIKSLFDQHHNALVSDNDGEYYLIDTRGNQISDTVASAMQRDGGYEMENKDGKYAIANEAGKTITEYKYNTVYYRSNAEPHNIWTGCVEDEDCDVIDGDTGKVIISNVNPDYFYTNYFTVINSEDKEDYYTYTGNLFYTAKE